MPLIQIEQKDLDALKEDKNRLDWLEKNASKIGIIPDWTWSALEESGYVQGSYENEHTNIRARVDKLMKEC